MVPFWACSHNCEIQLSASSLLSFLLSVRLPLGGFLLDLIFQFFFSKIYRGSSSFIEIWQEWRLLYIQTDIQVHWWSYLAEDCCTSIHCCWSDKEAALTSQNEKKDKLFSVHFKCYYSKTCLKRNAIVPVFFSVFTGFRFTKGCVLIKQSTKNMIA